MHTGRWRRCASATLSLAHSAVVRSTCPQGWDKPKRKCGCEQKHVESIAGRRRKRQRPSSAPLTEPHRAFKHNLQLLVGSPCQHCGSTSPSLAHSILPSSWRNPHCNRREGWWCRQERNRRRLALGSPFHGPCNTNLSYPPTNRPASWQNHQRNCMDRREEQAQSASAVASLASASVVEQWASASAVEQWAEGTQCGGFGSTKTSCLLANSVANPLRNCKGPQDRLAELAVVVVVPLAVLAAVLVAVLVAALAVEWQEPRW